MSCVQAERGVPLSPRGVPSTRTMIRPIAGRLLAADAVAVPVELAAVAGLAAVHRARRRRHGPHRSCAVDGTGGCGRRVRVRVRVRAPGPAWARVPAPAPGPRGGDRDVRDDAAGQRLVRARAEHRGDGVLLGLGHPEAVAHLDRDLPGHVGAAVALVRRQPGRGVAVPLRPVQRAVDGEQVQRVVGERRPAGGVQLWAPFCQASRRARRRGRSARPRWCPARAGRRSCAPEYGSARSPVSTTQSWVPGLNVSPVRSRARMSLRVSQPLRSTSTQPAPNCVAGVAGARRAALDLDGGQRGQRRGAGGGRDGRRGGVVGEQTRRRDRPPERRSRRSPPARALPPPPPRRPRAPRPPPPRTSRVSRRRRGASPRTTHAVGRGRRRGDAAGGQRDDAGGRDQAGDPAAADERPVRPAGDRRAGAEQEAPPGRAWPARRRCPASPPRRSPGRGRPRRPPRAGSSATGTWTRQP